MQMIVLLSLVAATRTARDLLPGLRADWFSTGSDGTSRAARLLPVPSRPELISPLAA